MSSSGSFPFRRHSAFSQFPYQKVLLFHGDGRTNVWTPDVSSLSPSDSLDPPPFADFSVRLDLPRSIFLFSPLFSLFFPVFVLICRLLLLFFASPLPLVGGNFQCFFTPSPILCPFSPLRPEHGCPSPPCNPSFSFPPPPIY